MSHWIYACASNALEPEEVQRFDHDGRTYAIYHGPDGNWYATDGLCTHERIHLADGFVFDFVVECPKHNGQFDFRTGEAIGPPVCIAIRTYPVKLQADGVYIDISGA